MKYLVYIAILLLNFNSCIAQQKTKMEDQIIIPKVTKEYETFNIHAFNKEVDSISGKRVLTNDVFYLEEETQNLGYISRKYLNDSYFMISKKYYKNGNIKQKGVSFNNGWVIGYIYEFNSEGQFIKEINTDEGYDVNKILEYCDKNNIVLTKGHIKSGGIPTEILKLEEEGIKIWQIMYYDKEQEKKFLVKLDGKSGGLLSKKELGFLD